MKKKVVLWFFLLVLIVGQGEVNAKFSQDPPEPMASDVPGSECAGEGTGSGPSVPVGLCLPINDYLVPLFVVGIVLGSFSLWQTEQKKQG